MRRLAELESEQMRAEVPVFRVGDTVDVAFSIVETVEVGRGKMEEKERIQIFNGTVIARKGSGSRENFVVRRIVAGEGVERIFPLHSPKIKSIEVKRMGRVRRAKLYYLRDRTGKATRVKERIWDKSRVEYERQKAARRAGTTSEE